MSQQNFRWWKYAYHTDKLDHGYDPIYDKYLSDIRTEVKNVVEIGSMPGSSRLWLDYFPNANVYSIDLNQFDMRDPRHVFLDINQSDSSTYSKLPIDSIDILIDDGPHTAPEQLISLQHLLPKIKAGGFYIIEDLHCTDEKYPDDYKKFMKDSDISVNNLLREWDNNVYNNYKYITSHKCNIDIYFDRGTKIRWSHMKEPSEIIFIKKK